MDGGKRRSETVKLASPANLDHVIYGLNPTLVPGWRLEKELKRTLEFITRWTVLYLIGSSGYFFEL